MVIKYVRLFDSDMLSVSWHAKGNLVIILKSFFSLKILTVQLFQYFDKLITILASVSCRSVDLKRKFGLEDRRLGVELQFPPQKKLAIYSAQKCASFAFINISLYILYYFFNNLLLISFKHLHHPRKTGGVKFTCRYKVAILIRKQITLVPFKVDDEGVSKKYNILRRKFKLFST